MDAHAHARKRGNHGHTHAVHIWTDRRPLAGLSCVIATAIAALAVLLTAPSLSLAASDSVSTFTKSGTDTTSSSTATAGGPAGTATAGDTINWVLSYENTTTSPATSTITDKVLGDQSFVSGSLVTPPNMTPSWSTNGGSTFTTTEPSSGVNAIQAIGKTFGTGVLGTANPPASGFTAGNSNGDGWESIFIGNNIYNVHHHKGTTSSDTTIDCHVVATGAECPGYPAAGTYVSGTAGAAFNTGPNTLDTSGGPNAVYNASGQIFYPVGVAGSTGVGVECVNVLTQTSCGYTQIASSTFPNAVFNGAGDAAAMIKSGGGIGSKMYVVTGNPGAPVYCVDTSASPPSICPGYPVQSDPTYAPAAGAATGSIFNASIKVYGKYVFDFIQHTNGSGDIGCVDTTTNAVCPGFPVTGITGTSQLAPTLDAAGNVTGICARTTGGAMTCFSLSGTPTGAPPWGVMVPGATNINSDGALVIGSRIYLAYYNAAGAATYACYDFSTNSTCAGFVQASSGQVVRAYTLRQDPNSPDCIWELGDAGVFEVFSATFGGTTCVESNTSLAAKPSQFYCDGKTGHVTGWSQISLPGLASSSYDAVAVTIKDANGNVVPGWQSKIVPSSQVPIDISSIPYAGSTTSLTVQVAISWGTHPPTVTTTAVTWKGDASQVCFKTKVKPDVCSGAGSLTDAANAITDAATAGSDAPSGLDSGTVTFNLKNGENQCWNTVVSKVPLAVPLIPGSNEKYAITVTNNGPDAAVPAVAVDRLPAGETFVSAQAGCSHSGGLITCTDPSLAKGASTTWMITTHVESSFTGTAVNPVCTATKPGPGPGSPTTCMPPPCNMAGCGVCTSNTRCSAPPVCSKTSCTPCKTTSKSCTPCATSPAKAAATTIPPSNTACARVPVVKPKLTKSVTPSVLTVGGLATYTLRTTNPSKYTMHDVKTCDPLPSGLAYVSSNPKATLESGLFCWTEPALAPHSSVVYKVVARALRVSHHRLVNRAWVTAREYPRKLYADAHVIVVAPKPPPPPITG